MYKIWPIQVLELNDVEKPTPKDDEILVEVHAASVNYNILVHRLNNLRISGKGLVSPMQKHERPT